MRETASVHLASSLLFQSCADDPGNDEHWGEFVRRYNPLFMRSITVAWRRYSSKDWPSTEVACDLLQDVYIAILKDGCRLLRQFRGQTEAEAEAYLAHFTMNQVVSHLRASGARKRQAELLSWDELVSDKESAMQFMSAKDKGSNALTEQDLLDVLGRITTGANSRRDILIFLLHIRDGWTASEIGRMGVCDLKESSIANLLVQMKGRVKKYLETQ
ncbi:MAG: RNA polymerase sigma factor [Blastocatellia bacterium]